MIAPSPVALPLAGRRVLLTRAAHQMSSLSDGLRALGAEPVEVPMLEIRPPENFAPLDAALRRLPVYDWLIFTSANTVRVLTVRAAEKGISLEGKPLPKIAAIGNATAEAARKAGFQVALVPDAYVAESLVQALAAEAAGKRVLLARAAVARDVIPEEMRKAGATVDVVDAYRNVLPDEAPEMLREALKKHVDAACFSSSSSVIHLAQAARRAGIEFPLAGVVAVSIGPITSDTLRGLGWEPAREANPSDVPGLIGAVKQALTNRIAETTSHAGFRTA
ncbi:MAG TPA: uroporphyrinogen-III synthase [Terracidiphilus sp.]|nr:uroporphyrinogen-III synthase [Terracidiphilus sp.]